MNRKIFYSVAALLLIGGLLVSRRAWSLPRKAYPYAADIAAAEINNGLPNMLLARLLYQESRFRPDIINGSTVSSAGAVGIAQIVPRWHPGVNPLDPVESIHYAADYLATLHGRFGTWAKALAAYNWGPGNLSQAIAEHGENWFNHMPDETRAYVTEITTDVRVYNA